MTFFVVSELGNYYFDVCGGSRESGTGIIGYPFHGASNQTFTMRDNHIFSVSSGLALDVELNTGKLIINEKSKSINQLWFFHDDGSIRNCYNQCLTLIKDPKRNRGDIFLQSWTGSKAQKWRIVTKPL